MKSRIIERAVSTSLILLSFLNPTLARAADFEVFDGRVYNGKYYPRIDVIEWGTPSHMEFHIYDKINPPELAFELDTKTGRKVMLVNYHFKQHGQKLCRRVLAPGHFHEGFTVYMDNSDPDFNNIIVSVHELPAKKGLVKLIRPFQYASCTADQPDRGIASKKEAGDHGNIAPPNVSRKKTGQPASFTNW